mmetsp:Transcript_25737/g.69861  ORF Transcript_25737/g.69861 Transcript_25737/m.69861 type:complete len:203 (-) Transcript_25737:1408-2016(-)
MTLKHCPAAAMIGHGPAAPLLLLLSLLPPGPAGAAGGWLAPSACSHPPAACPSLSLTPPKVGPSLGPIVASCSCFTPTPAGFAPAPVAGRSSCLLPPQAPGGAVCAWQGRSPKPAASIAKATSKSLGSPASKPHIVLSVCAPCDPPSPWLFCWGAGTEQAAWYASWSRGGTSSRCTTYSGSRNLCLSGSAHGTSCRLILQRT